MPVLHQYKGKEEFYILTAINGAIVTFQLNHEGRQRLKGAGIEPGDKFGRALLLDIYRSGDAFTHGTGAGTTVEEIDEGQMIFDFSNDPEPESLFPTCGECSSLNDLHLVELKETEPAATILCASCRIKNSSGIDTSIPLPLASRSVLNRLFAMKNIHKLHKSVMTYQNLLDAQFVNRWETVARSKKQVQQTALFDSLGENKLF